MIAMAAWLLTLEIACGHGDLHEQISRITSQIRQSPLEVDLYLRRARLNHLHQDWAAASADYQRAETLAPTLDAIRLGRGQMLLAAARLEDAKSELDKFLTKVPLHVDGLITRARVEARLGRPRAAGVDFLRAIELAPHPEPELYLECAQTLSSIDAEHTGVAIGVLDQGIAKLGNLPSLGVPALDLEVRLERFDAALARIQRLSTTSARRETWLARRGDVLMQAGRVHEARESYHASNQCHCEPAAPRKDSPSNLGSGGECSTKAHNAVARPNIGRPKLIHHLWTLQICPAFIAGTEKDDERLPCRRYFGLRSRS